MKTWHGAYVGSFLCLNETYFACQAFLAEIFGDYVGFGCEFPHQSLPFWLSQIDGERFLILPCLAARPGPRLPKCAM
jgi:hypothetical protein